MKTTKGIVIRLFNSKDADKIVYLLTDTGEKLILSAKGVKKSGSKKAHSLDIGNYIQVSLVDGYSIPIISEAKLLNEFSNWKKDYKSLVILQLVCEVLDKLTAEDQVTNAYTYFYEILQHNTKPYLAASYVILKLIMEGGFLPELNKCQSTGEVLSGDQFWISKSAPGFFSELDPNATDFISISPKLVKSIIFMVNKDYKNSLKLTLTDSEEEEIMVILIDWFTLSTDVDLKSKKIIYGLRASQNAVF